MRAEDKRGATKKKKCLLEIWAEANISQKSKEALKIFNESIN